MKKGRGKEQGRGRMCPLTKPRRRGNAEPRLLAQSCAVSKSSWHR